MRTMAMALLLLFFTQSLAQDQCRPTWSPTTKEFGPLYIYRETDIRDIKIYSCNYTKETSYHSCVNNIMGDVIRVEHDRYSDFTRNCIDAERGGFTDKYGAPYNIASIDKQNGVSYVVNCKDGGYEKLIKITRKQMVASADLSRNEITLPSGSVCKYNHGFCYDKTMGTNFMWEVIPPQHSCKNLKQYTAETGSFFLKIGKNYLVSKIEAGHAVLELEDAVHHNVCDVKAWKAKNVFSFVSNEEISEATLAGRMETKEYTAFFEEKAKLLEYLVRRCQKDLFNPTDPFELARVTLDISVAVEKNAYQIEKNVNKWRENGILINDLRGRVERLYKQLLFVSVVILICGIAFGCKTVVKFILRTRNGCRKEDGPTKNIPLVKNAEYYDGVGAFSVQTYETIGSDYDINGFYNRK